MKSILGLNIARGLILVINEKIGCLNLRDFVPTTYLTHNGTYYLGWAAIVL